MAIVAPYRPPVPLFLPALSAMLVLLVLFFFGLQEQRRLAAGSAEQQIQQREEIARIVAETIESDLNRTEASVRRFARDLAVNLESSRPDAATGFEQLFQPLPDGSIRTRRDRFDPMTDAGVWIPNYLQPDLRLREFFVRAKNLVELYGRGSHGQVFVDSWILPAVSGIVIFWPDEPEFVYQATADFDYRDSEWVQPTTPARNPNRRSYWTKLAFDPTPQIWMLSAVAPLYWRGEWFGAVGHDVPLAKLLARTDLLRQQPGSRFILLTGDGVVAASDVYAELIKASKGETTVDQLPDPIWQQVVTLAQANTATAPLHQRVALPDHVAFVSRIRTQNWLLVNLMPLAPISARIDASFTNLRNIAIATLLLELLIATGLLAYSHHRSRRYFTELGEVQQRLSLSEAHYRNLVANIPGLVYRCDNDRDWTMNFLSPATAELTGYAPEDLLHNNRRSYASIIHPDDQQQVFDTVQAAVDAQRPFMLEYRILRRDGQQRWVLERGRPVLQNGELLMLEGVVLDITPLKAAEEKLRELNDTLEQQVEQRTAELRTAVKELETFNYAVSHDLRAPLRHVGSYLEMLQDDLGEQLDAESRALFGRCQRALKRMNEMIAGMLALAQLGRDGLTLTRIDLTQMVQELLAELPVEQRAAVQFDIGPLPVVSADRVLLRQVLQNLLDNAIKYSTNRPQPLVGIHDCTAGQDAQEFVLEVRDNGVGFDANYAEHLFTLFRRLHSAEDYPGTGVGLALCAKILALHGGRIWAQSERDKGASFFIALPVLPRTHSSRVLLNTSTS